MLMLALSAVLPLISFNPLHPAHYHRVYHRRAAALIVMDEDTAKQAKLYSIMAELAKQDAEEFRAAGADDALVERSLKLGRGLDAEAARLERFLASGAAVEAKFVEEVSPEEAATTKLSLWEQINERASAIKAREQKSKPPAAAPSTPLADAAAPSSPFELDTQAKAGLGAFAVLALTLFIERDAAVAIPAIGPFPGFRGPPGSEPVALVGALGAVGYGVYSIQQEVGGVSLDMQEREQRQQRQMEELEKLRAEEAAEEAAAAAAMAEEGPPPVVMRLPENVTPGAVLACALPDGTRVTFKAPANAQPGMLVDLAAALKKQQAAAEEEEEDAVVEVVAEEDDEEDEMEEEEVVTEEEEFVGVVTPTTLPPKVPETPAASPPAPPAPVFELPKPPSFGDLVGAVKEAAAPSTTNNPPQAAVKEEEEVVLGVAADGPTETASKSWFEEEALRARKLLRERIAPEEKPKKTTGNGRPYEPTFSDPESFR